MLSTAQQQQIIDNEWIINTVCKRLNITDHDIRSELTLFMCQTIAKYDESKGATLGTYLFSSVYLRALRLLKEKTKHNYHYVLTDIAPVPINAPKDNSKIKIIYKRINCQMECDILTYKLQGYSGREISIMLSIPEHKVNRCYRKFVQRVQLEVQNKAKIDT